MPSPYVFDIFALNILQHLQDQLMCESTQTFQVMHSSGTIQLNQHSIPIKSILFDTGALHANYINSSLVLSNSSLFSPFLYPTNACVTLADKVTKVRISHVLKVPLSIQGTTRVCYFYVMNDLSTDIIIGLPSILYHYFDVFMSILNIARETLLHPDSVINRNVNVLSHSDIVQPTVETLSISVIKPLVDSTLREPWTTVDVLAPEDVESYEPSMFSHALHFMEMSIEQAQQEYFDLFDSHISDEFISACPRVIDLLKTKGLQVFVPQNWLGINGIEPIQFQFSPDMPQTHKPKVRPVNAKLFADTRAEWLRLLEYHLELCDSSFVSNLVVAPKATKPFVRLCGDYVYVNKFITAGYFIIPSIPHVLEKISTFSIYIDLDLVNAFHQLPLDEATSRKLAIITPWGTARPKFLPEGVKPASEILQRVVHELFEDFSDFLIYQFDNLLLLAHDYNDAFIKLEKVLDRCIERNVFLKFSKSFIGYKKVNFFGYECQHRYYNLSQERKNGIANIPFPTNLKQMQSFLGAALFFKSFVPHYSTLTAKLNDMIHKDFPWNKPDEWKHDYQSIFEEFKLALLAATANFYPDYKLDWILRTDASLYGVGAVLLQLYVDPDTNEVQHQPIAFASKKFSPQAQKWSTIEQEAFGIYFAVHHFAYYLRCKDFVIETDHNNLIWIEASLVPKVIRWRIYLQSFRFLIRHIPGKQNAVADWLSRLHAMSHGAYFPSVADTNEEEEDDDSPTGTQDYDNYCYACSCVTQPMRLQRIAPQRSSRFSDSNPVAIEMHNPLHDDDPAIFHIPDDTKKMSDDVEDDHVATFTPTNDTSVNEDINQEATVEETAANDDVTEELVVEQLSQIEMLNRVHNARVGHSGIKTTHKRLNELYPGHGLSIKQIDDFISNCATCQKDRLTMTTALKPVIRHIKPPHARSAVGVDTLSISPPDRYGHTCLIVIVNHFTKYTYIYPAKDHGAESLARALFVYFTTFGICEEIHSDPGSDLTSEVIDHLHRWFGIKHVFSLVDRHQSNGVEGPNRIILRHLKALVMDERLTESWGEDINIAIVTYLLNTVDSSETGIVPMHAHFGSADATYHRLPLTNTDTEKTHAYVRRLDQQIRYLMDKSKQYQAELISKRLQTTTTEQQNMYQEGDYVLVKMDADGNRLPTKLSPRYFGPYRVIQQYKNDVTCVHLTRHKEIVVHVERVKPFYGTDQAAHEAALRDYDEYDVIGINAYSGDPMKRSTLQFRVTYASGYTGWLPYTDLSQNAFLDTYCQTRPELMPVLYPTLKAAKDKLSELRGKPITTVQPGDKVYVSLRYYGAERYDDLPMEDKYDLEYVVEHNYEKWANATQTKIVSHCPVFNIMSEPLDLLFVTLYGSNKVFDETKMMLVDSQIIVKYPAILPDNKSKQALLRHHKRVVSESLPER